MTSSPRLILNADDLGIHPSIDRGIREAFESGLLSSATLLATTPYTESAAAMAREIGLPTGLHLSLTLGQCAARPDDVPHLVDERGNLHHTARHYLFLGRQSDIARATYEEIRREFDAQFARARDLGVDLTHADSHQHVHMNPMIYRIVEGLAPRYGVTTLRFSHEPFCLTPFLRDGVANLRRRNPLKRAALASLSRRIRPRLAHPDGFFGVGHSGVLGAKALASYVRQIRPGQTVEIGLHPGHPARAEDSPYDIPGVTEFIAAADRGRELAAVTADTVRTAVDRANVAMISYRDLADG